MASSKELAIITPADVLPTKQISDPYWFTDLANARALVTMAGGTTRWVPGIGWLFWDGMRWQRDEGDVYVSNAAKRAILTLATMLKSGVADMAEYRDDWSAWLKRSQNDGLLSSMLRVARTEPDVVAYVRQLDADPNALNTQSGILDLTTFDLRPHDPAALHTKVTAAGFDADAEAPFWQATLAKALPDEGIRRHVQKAFGQALRGTYSENLFILHGSGSNLKSTILDAVHYALGDYADVPSADLLIEQKGGSARGDSALAQLRGVRLATASETGEGLPLAEPLIKTLTGDHTINCKFMRMDTFTYQNQASVFLATNHRPRVQGSDEAIWRRLQLIPFDYVMPNDERREPEEVRAILHAERDGILRWLVDGLRLWRDEGLERPDAIRAATSTYRTESDPMAEWIEDEVVFQDGASARVRDVRASYEEHCKQTGRPYVLAAQRFNADLERRGCVRRKGQDQLGEAKMWFGLYLHNPPLALPI
jgi:putative DNA primase/helicase